MTPPSIAVPDIVVATIRSLDHALGGPVTIVGGWAVGCRLRMARRTNRPTEDVDAMITTYPRPTPAALASIDAVQDDPEHPCRVTGLPLLVDLLADSVSEGAVPLRPGGAEDELVSSEGLHLLVPPFGALLARTGEAVSLTATGAPADSVGVRLPLAGALFAGKVGSLALEHRTTDKRASDGEDAVRLLEAFGTLAMADDLGAALPAERADLRRLLDAIRGSGLAAQSRVSGYAADPLRLEEACEQLLDELSPTA